MYSKSWSETTIVLKRKPEQRAAGRGNCWGSVNVSMSQGRTFFFARHEGAFARS